MLTVMEWECLDCGKWFKKTARQQHLEETDHLFSVHGVIRKGDGPETMPPPRRHQDSTKSAPRGAKEEIESKLGSERTFTGNARTDYPKTYALFDKIRGYYNASARGQ